MNRLHKIRTARNVNHHERRYVKGNLTREDKALRKAERAARRAETREIVLDALAV